MINTVIVCKGYKHGQKAAKLLGRNPVIDFKKERGVEYFSDVLILKLSDGVNKLKAYELPETVNVIVLNDVRLCGEDARQLASINIMLGMRKR